MFLLTLFLSKILSNAGHVIFVIRWFFKCRCFNCGVFCWAYVVTFCQGKFRILEHYLLACFVSKIFQGMVSADKKLRSFIKVQWLQDRVITLLCIPFSSLDAGIDQMFPSNYLVLFLNTGNHSNESLYQVQSMYQYCCASLYPSFHTIFYSAI